MILVPKLHFVAGFIDHGEIDFPDRADDLPAVTLVDDGFSVLVSLDDLVRVYADDQIIAILLRMRFIFRCPTWNMS
jgi:hypothetical protein